MEGACEVPRQKQEALSPEASRGAAEEVGRRKETATAGTSSVQAGDFTLGAGTVAGRSGRNQALKRLYLQF